MDQVRPPALTSIDLHTNSSSYVDLDLEICGYGLPKSSLPNSLASIFNSATINDCRGADISCSALKSQAILIVCDTSTGISSYSIKGSIAILVNRRFLYSEF